MQLASWSPFSGQIIINNFFLQDLLIFSFIIFFNFRTLLRKIFAKISLFRDRPSAGGYIDEKWTPGALVVASLLKI